MTEPAKIQGKILNDSSNYAAIYARISSLKDNNSINAQISKAKMIINNENLLLYAVYTDQVSGISTAPPDRKGFGKLLEDAKAGCFKTIVAYRHDRIARNLKDWIDLKAQLRKLGIKIIFSDESEYTSDNSLQGDFLENLILMVAQLEPNSIKERASSGRKQRRLEGIYNSAKNVPFGYIRKNSNLENPSKGKSFYTTRPLQAVFVQKVFCEAKNILGKSNIEYEKLKKIITNFIDTLLEQSSHFTISDMLLTYSENIKLELIKGHKEESFLETFIKNLKIQLKESSLNDIKKDLQDIKEHLESTGNLQTLLKNSIYGQYMLLDSNEENQGVIIEDNIPRINWSSFKLIQNVAPIIDVNTFSKVYGYMTMEEILKPVEPDYLFKGKLKCGCCNVKLKLTDGLLECTKTKKDKNPGCKSYVKNSVIEAILDIILDDAFKNSSEGFNNFSKTIEEKLNILRTDLQKLRNQRITILKEYLKTKDIKCTESVKSLEDSINILLDKIANYANELSYIHKLRETIEQYNNLSPEVKKIYPSFKSIKSTIISYIVSNQDTFNSIFDKLIKEIKVSTVEQKHNIKSRFTVNYEFTYDKPGNIPTCIN